MSRSSASARRDSRGLKHHTAVRALAFKWIRIPHGRWKDRTAYDEYRCQQALERHASPPGAARVLLATQEVRA